MVILLVSIIIALIVVIFAVQNAAVVPIHFLFWTADLPLVLVIFCSVFAGALLMFCLALRRELKCRKETKVNKKFTSKRAAASDADPIDIPQRDSQNKDGQTVAKENAAGASEDQK